MAQITAYWLWNVAILILLLVLTIYVYFRRSFKYFEKRGIPVPFKPCFPYGNFAGVNRIESLEQIMARFYLEAKEEKLIGCYLFNKPIILLRDAELVKNILVKDFTSFHDRGFEIDLKKDPLQEHLFQMKGQAWRNMRIRISPTFTSGKMKMMFPTMLEVGKKLVAAMEKTTKLPESDIKDLTSRYTSDVIASVAFGIETNSLENPDSEFREMGNAIFHENWKMKLMSVLMFTSPWLAKVVPFSMIPKRVNDFFIKVVQETMDYRINNNIKRNDFLQLLLELRTLGYIKDADNKEISLEDQQKFTFQQAASLSFVFFVAGFEASSSTAQFALYELALNPELQTKLQQDIDQALDKHNGELAYEDVMGMDLLDRVINETLRKYPVAQTLMRQCNREYNVPDTDIVLQPGDQLWVSVYGYHHDPKFFPNPEKFDPDRFLPEVRETRHQYAYLPFGEGPRNCIGNRFALMQTKSALALILSQFTVAPSENTPIPLAFNPGLMILTPKEKIYFKVTKRR